MRLPAVNKQTSPLARPGDRASNDLQASHDARAPLSLWALRQQARRRRRLCVHALHVGSGLRLPGQSTVSPGRASPAGGSSSSNRRRRVVPTSKHPPAVDHHSLSSVPLFGTHGSGDQTTFCLQPRQGAHKTTKTNQSFGTVCACTNASFDVEDGRQSRSLLSLGIPCLEMCTVSGSVTSACWLHVGLSLSPPSHLSKPGL